MAGTDGSSDDKLHNAAEAFLALVIKGADERELLALYRSVNERTRLVALEWFRYIAEGQAHRHRISVGVQRSWTAERIAKASVAQKAAWARRRAARKLPGNVLPFPTGGRHG